VDLLRIPIVDIKQPGQNNQNGNKINVMTSAGIVQASKSQVASVQFLAALMLSHLKQVIALSRAVVIRKSLRLMAKVMTV